MYGIYKHMAMHLIDISGDDLKDIKVFVGQGRFESVEEFLNVALRNQLLLERQHQLLTPTALEDGAIPQQHYQTVTGSVTKPPEAAGRSSAASLFPPAVDCESILALQDREDVLLDSKPTTRGPLFGQFYRFLPLKIVLRIVAANSRQGMPEIGAVARQVVQIANTVGNILRERERDKQSAIQFSLATGVPSEERDLRKSSARFESQYLGRIKKSGQADGFGFALGFLGWREDKDQVRIGLTDPGYRFAMFKNPVLDAGGDSPLSPAEACHLTSWIRERLPYEYEHMEQILSFVRGGANTPSTLAQLMLQFYLDRFGDERWTIPKANLTRSGGVSRLVEMQVLQAVKEGPRVIYAVNEEMATSAGF